MKIVSLKCFSFRAAKLRFFSKYLNSVGNIFGRPHFAFPCVILMVWSAGLCCALIFVNYGLTQAADFLFVFFK